MAACVQPETSSHDRLITQSVNFIGANSYGNLQDYCRQDTNYHSRHHRHDTSRCLVELRSDASIRTVTCCGIKWPDSSTATIKVIPHTPAPVLIPDPIYFGGTQGIQPPAPRALVDNCHVMFYLAPDYYVTRPASHQINTCN